MLYVSIVLFAVAAVFGATAAVRQFSGKAPALGLALVHGPFAAAGLAVLIAFLLSKGGAGLLPVSLVIFLVAAVGGLIMLALHLTRGKLWTPLVLIHGLAAVVAFVLLLVFVFGGAR